VVDVGLGSLGGVLVVIDAFGWPPVSSARKISAAPSSNSGSTWDDARAS